MQTNNLVNREFGDYHILRKIGSGAMAEVYLAEQRSLGRRVALKILKSEFSQDETYVKRFVREARAIARLTHPNLVQIFQADCIDGYWFIAQEYVQGQTLQKLIQMGGSVPFQRVADILWQISSSLDKASEAGIVHRDVKPDNILLGDNGDVKIADFGLARLIGTGDTSLALTQTGMTLGTPLYMSPEQAQGKSLDLRSDMYSLGITCYHALAGRPPFRGETALAVALQHVNEDSDPLVKLRPDIPPPLARIVHRMIEKSPEDRFQSFQEVQRELRSFYSVFLHDEEAASRLTDWNRFPMGRSDEMLLATTEKLGRVMQRERRLAGKKGRKRRWTLLLLVLFLCGFGLGFLRVYSMSDPLHQPVPGRITRRDTIEEQWVYACMLDNVDAWQSVIDYYPESNDYWGSKAKRQLARLYFQEGDTRSAFPIFREFSELSDVYVDDLALGLVGRAWYLAEVQDNMNLPLEYLRQLHELDFPYNDLLIIQILDATNKTIQEKKTRAPSESTPTSEGK